jgi:hypothetical protein
MSTGPAGTAGAVACAGGGNVTAAVTTADTKTGDVVNQNTVGSVVLRGTTVPLDSDVGETFITDCCRNV